MITMTAKRDVKVTVVIYVGIRITKTVDTNSLAVPYMHFMQCSLSGYYIYI